MRRVTEFDGITFSSNGELFFGTRGDLWNGIIDLEEQDYRGVLVANRCAPLATLETAFGTQGQMGAERVAVATDELYVHVCRMAGSGWGKIVRLNKPPAYDQEVAASDLKKRLALYAKEVASVEILAENGTRSYLCTSPDGKRAFFSSDVLGVDKRQFFLVEDNGMPQELSVKVPKS